MMERWYPTSHVVPTDPLRQLPVHAVHTQLQRQLSRDTTSLPIPAGVIHLRHPRERTLLRARVLPALHDLSTTLHSHARLRAEIPPIGNPRKRQIMILVPMEQWGRLTNEPTKPLQLHMINPKPLHLPRAGGVVPFPISP